MADTLSTNVRKFRINRKLTITELAARSGIPREELSRLENEHATNPTRDRIEALAAALEVSAGDLLDA